LSYYDKHVKHYVTVLCINTRYGSVYIVKEKTAWVSPMWHHDRRFC